MYKISSILVVWYLTFEVATFVVKAEFGLGHVTFFTSYLMSWQARASLVHRTSNINIFMDPY